ncbi:hypothetical protein BN14_09096 [Rhizoctonia solani AG-1 IB]|uniref:Nephrocystin 3-like N-terminal domain-containing protein n=1 Tax=Thanatephorus cucumeris (strain AG1-IB / isolate 7/3/14) TaxID=1108050 RepID=M5C4U6_THACB|nr:hypothetical protein BN14_09096 [Rhizoctonia solani AG-1 IB]
MSFMMSLRDSLKRARGKLRFRSQLKQADPDSIQIVPDARPVSSPTHQPMVPASHSIVSKNTGHEQCEVPLDSNTVPTNNQVSDKGISTRSVIETLLVGLQATGDCFGPLRVAVDGIAKRGSEESKEYDKLQKKLEHILQDIAQNAGSPSRLFVTPSVEQIYSDIKAEATRAEDKRARNTGRKIVDALRDSDDVLECYSRIADHMRRLMLTVSLSTLKVVSEQGMVQESRLAKMSSVKSAFYNSHAVSRGGCAPHTREPQIDLLMEWARTPGAGRTCWMNGMAGTGKTTIAYTVCERLGIQLGASFFCSRTLPECRQVGYIIPCISYQLARFSAPFHCALDRVLESDPDIHCRKIQLQYEKLIVQPLRNVYDSLPALQFIVVIDALEECEDPESVGQILDLLLSKDYDLPIRFLVSSRPESQISQRMADRTDGSPEEARLVLHDLESEGVRSDIEAYMRHELKDVTLTSVQWSGILEQCGVLFIYASTLCRFIRQGHATESTDEVVETIIKSLRIPMKGDNSIDKLYHTILAASLGQDGMTDENTRRMKAVLETVICAIEPMTLDTIANLLGLKSARQVHALLRPLRSVLNVEKGTGLVTTLHASFPDFMLSRDRSVDFSCDHILRHATMAEACLRLIDNAEPKVNICALPSSHLLDSHVEGLGDRVRQTISPGLSYACRHWSAHLNRGEYRESLLDSVRRFFFHRLLLWMEVLNLTGTMRYGPVIIEYAERWCATHNALDGLAKMAHDAGQFVSVYANHPLCKSTPHIYMSMLPFWPRSRPVSAAYIPRTVGLVEPFGPAMGRRTLALLATWKASNRWIQSMGPSGKGTRLAVPTGDGIDMIDTTTGESVVRISNGLTKSVSFLAMSDDGSHLVFAAHSALRLVDVKNGYAISELTVFDSSQNGEVHIWSLQPKLQHIGPLNGHTEGITSVAFSPDGSYLASGSLDRTIHTWDVQTGQAVEHPFVGHNNSITSVAYSPCNSRLASASFDGKIRVWDSQTRQSTLTISAHHSHDISSVAFSPSGAFIASGSKDNTIRVFDAYTGHPLLGPLRGHTDWVTSVVFSPDSFRLFSCSNDGTVRMWDVQDAGAHDALLPASALSQLFFAVGYSRNGLRAVSGSSDGTVYVWDVQTGDLALQPLRGHDKGVSSVNYSPDDRYIASASSDGTLRIWDAWTGQDIHGPIQGHTSAVKCVRFSPDGLLLVSASNDRTVRLWDVASGRLLMQLFKGDSRINSVGFSPHGQLVVCGPADGSIRVIDRRTGDIVVGPIRGHSKSISSVEFSPDGRYIVSGSNDTTVRIWDAQTGKQLLLCGGRESSHDYLVWSVVFSPDGRYVVSGSADSTVRVWDAQTGTLILGPLRAHTNSVRCVDFSPDGSHVVSCSKDGTIRFWDMSSCATNMRPHVESSKGGGKAVTFDPNPNRGHNSWSLDDDGWVLDAEGKRLVWVPPNIRSGLAVPPNNMIIGNQGCLLDFKGVVVGETWAGCYQP